MRLIFSTKRHWRYFWFQTSLLYKILSDKTYRLFLHTIQSTKSCALYHIPLYYSIHLTPNNTKTSDSNYKHFLSFYTKRCFKHALTNHMAREREPKQSSTIIECHHWEWASWLTYKNRTNYEVSTRFIFVFPPYVRDSCVSYMRKIFSHTHKSSAHLKIFFFSLWIVLGDLRRELFVFIRNGSH